MNGKGIPAGAVPIDSRSNPHEVFNPDRYPSARYFATRDGAVYSTWAEDYLRPTLNSVDRYQLTPTFRGRNKTVLLHRLIAYAFCPNGRRLSLVHHINGIKTDNRANNLLYVTPSEHGELHKLLKTNRAKYRLRIAEIRQLNRWKSKREYIVLDSHFESKTLEGGYSLDRVGWQKYNKRNKLEDVPVKSIITVFVRKKER